MSQDLQLKDFIYELPETLIAQEPLKDRDQSRLLLYREGSIEDRQFAELAALLPEDSILVVNDSRVMPSRILGKTKTGGKAELLLLEQQGDVWKTLGKPTKKFAAGAEIFFDGDVIATIVEPPVGGEAATPFTVKFNLDDVNFSQWLNANGYVPLPPYIARPEAEKAPKSKDSERYQTVYAETVGSAAAPTAGLHFTPRILAELEKKRIRMVPVTLHVGAGTFLPVKTDNISEHVMHEERFLLSEASLRTLKDAEENKRRVFAVGTTSLRCIESFHQQFPSWGEKISHSGQWHRTRLFIRPKSPQDRYRPWLIDGIVTNFHQPGSTLYMLVSALLGFDSAQKIYRHAVEKRYRFLSYGDANLYFLDQ